MSAEAKITIIPRYDILIDGAHAPAGVPIEVLAHTAAALLAGGFATVRKTERKETAAVLPAAPAVETATAAHAPAASPRNRNRKPSPAAQTP